MTDGRGDTSAAGVLAEIGLRTKIQRAWATYDWANSAMIVIVVTAIYRVRGPWGGLG